MTTNNNTAQTTKTGIGLFGWLTIIFVVLKLNPGGYLDSDVENWSWWLVFSPVLVVLGIIALIFAGIGVAFLVAFIRDKHVARKRKKARLQREKESEERRAQAWNKIN